MNPIRIGVVAALLCGSSVSSSASPVTLEFYGTLDLSSFGASPTSRFEGSVTWDTATAPDEDGGFFTRYLLDGSPSSVTATFSVNSVDYTDRIAPFSRFEQLSTRSAGSLYDELFLQLFFDPPAGLDGGPGADLAVVALALWNTKNPLFGDAQHGDLDLPGDLSFLSGLEHRRIWFGGYSGTFTDDFVVPEPSSLTLLALGLGAVSARLRSNRRGRGRTRR